MSTTAFHQSEFCQHIFSKTEPDVFLANLPADCFYTGTLLDDGYILSLKRIEVERGQLDAVVVTKQASKLKPAVDGTEKWTETESSQLAKRVRYMPIKSLQNYHFYGSTIWFAMV